jgi:acyl CoA:acetate/3-ketoacid CoA transferase alpha subunit
MIPLWAIRLAPYAAGGLLAVGAYFWAYGRGEDAERAKWQKAESAAVAAAQAQTAALQAQVDAAGTALSQMTAENDRLATLAAQSRKAFYVQNPAAAAVVCLPDSRLLHHQRADEAANAAITAR